MATVQNHPPDPARRLAVWSYFWAGGMAEAMHSLDLVMETATETQLRLLRPTAGPLVVKFQMTQAAHHLPRSRFSCRANLLNALGATTASNQRRTDWDAGELSQVNGVDRHPVHLLKSSDSAGKWDEVQRVLAQYQRHRTNVSAREHLLLWLPARARRLFDVDDAELLLPVAPLNLELVLGMLDDPQPPRSVNVDVHRV